MADFTNLQNAITALNAQVQATKGVKDSVIAYINGFAQQVTEAVTKALQDDNAADDASVAAATAAIEEARVGFEAAANETAAAINTNPRP